MITILTLGLWLATGAHPYTKFSVVERVEVPPDPDDPLAGTGFYDNEAPVYRTVRRDVFYFGLIPTPQGLFDKHLLSVASIALPVWAIALVLVWLGRRRAPATSGAGRAPSPGSGNGNHLREKEHRP